MISFRWILSILGMPFLWRPRIPLVRPRRLDWNPSLSPQTVQVKGHTIFYVVKGEGEPLLMIHGFGAGLWVWEKQIEALSRFYRVYALDLIGHGFSDRPRIDYTPETYIHFLKDFMEGVGLKRASLIGNSMGGGIAWAMAILFPERVHRLILIDCAPPDVLDQVKNDSFKTLVAIKDVPLLSHLVIAGRNKDSIKQVLKECIFNIQLVTPEIVNRQYQISRIKGTTWVLYSTFKNGKGAEGMQYSLSSFPPPTLLIWGEKDLIFSPSLGEVLHRAIKDSTFHVIKGSGHIPMWENPEETNRLILSFLK